MSARLCLGVVIGAHGIRGQVRIKSFTEDPQDIAAYGALSDEAGRSYRLSVAGMAKGAVLARIEGIGDRNAAEALKGTQLFVDRAALPGLEEEETFYRADLIGLRAEDRQGRLLGRVAAVENFGAGDVLEVKGQAGGSVFYPFTRAVVPEVDLPGGRVVVDPPEEVEASKPEENGSGSGQTGSEAS